MSLLLLFRGHFAQSYTEGLLTSITSSDSSSSIRKNREALLGTINSSDSLSNCIIIKFNVNSNILSSDSLINPITLNNSIYSLIQSYDSETDLREFLFYPSSVISSQDSEISNASLISIFNDNVTYNDSLVNFNNSNISAVDILNAIENIVEIPILNEVLTDFFILDDSSVNGIAALDFISDLVSFLDIESVIEFGHGTFLDISDYIDYNDLVNDSINSNESNIDLLSLNDNSINIYNINEILLEGVNFEDIINMITGTNNSILSNIKSSDKLLDSLKTYYKPYGLNPKDEFFVNSAFKHIFRTAGLRWEDFNWNITDYLIKSGPESSPTFGTIYINSIVVGAGTDLTDVPVLNQTTGKVRISAGKSSVTLINKYITLNSLVFCQILKQDSNLTSVIPVVSKGQVIIQGNDVTNLGVEVAFWVINCME